jgi:hypothetical protein
MPGSVRRGPWFRRRAVSFLLKAFCHAWLKMVDADDTGRIGARDTAHLTYDIIPMLTAFPVLPDLSSVISRIIPNIPALFRFSTALPAEIARHLLLLDD